MNLKSKHLKTEWHRVNRVNPCHVCLKPDWCTYTVDSYCCMRVQSAVTMANGGWLHASGDERVKHVVMARAPVISKEPPVDCEKIYRRWSECQSPQALTVFAEKIGVDPMSLVMIGCIWSIESNAWAFPMKDALENIVGIRLRNEEGRKWAVKGSKQGLFIPGVSFPEGVNILFITEGPTDCAACLTMDLYAIGRPSCLGCEDMISLYLKKNRIIKRVVIMADNDQAGLTGAVRLQSTLALPSTILTLPAKDVRSFVGLGGTKAVIESMLNNVMWQQPKKAK